MKKIEDVAAFIFIIAVAILSVVSVLGIWDFFKGDVIMKSFETLGLLAVVAIVVLVAGKFIENRSQAVVTVPEAPNPAFKSMRQITLAVLIIAVSFLAILGVLAIWEVIQDKQTLYKALSSVGVLAFSSFLIVMTSLEREGNEVMDRMGKGSSIGGIISVLVIAYIVFLFVGGSF